MAPQDTTSELCKTTKRKASSDQTSRKRVRVSESLTRRKASEGPSSQVEERTFGLKERESASFSVDTSRAEFEARYIQESQLGEGGFGSVFAGYRKTDNLPVAIKHIPKDKVFWDHKAENRKQLSLEVAIMLELQGGKTGAVEGSSTVSLLDWYDLQQEQVLVLERPVPAQDLFNYIETSGGCLEEDTAKIILKQLVDGALELEKKNIFHRDIKVENVLIETGSDVPRVWLIDFGLSCFVQEGSLFKVFHGTAAHAPPEWYSCCSYSAGPTTVWQLGVLLYESLHSQFETPEFLSNKLKISKRLSKRCQNFLRNCLKKVPEQRPTLEQLRQHPWLKLK